MSERLILIAEDDPDDQLMLADAFGENNATENLKFVESGDEVLAFLNGQTHQLPALIMLDLNMPKLDGRSLLKLLKSDPKTQSIPVVVLTTANAAAEQVNVFDLGAADFFTKPASFLELVRITTCILQKWLPNKTS